MNDSKNKRTSIAAFLFMPQFGMCFQGFSHLVPVFMRVLAGIFVTANLIPNDHLALHYGAKGVRRCGFGELLGDAWYTLRTTKANPYQWSIFASVILMIASVISAVVGAVLRVFFGLGATAHAQMFTHLYDPYQKGVGVTSIDPAVKGIPAAADGALFDNRVLPGEAAQDWGLLMLDKIIRQGAAGTGGTLQNAVGTLLQFYSTGVMVIAAIMIFWIILSVVVDTAKTGTIGGGRHNMVWAPIRIVFALGLMIPLGSVGFSSGQYGVMKLAEWGSNFASKGWSLYVASAMTGNQLLAPFKQSSVSEFVNNMTKTMVCAVAYNTYVYQSTSPPAADQLIKMKLLFSQDRTMVQMSYTNATDPNICGTITVPFYDWTALAPSDSLQAAVTQAKNQMKGNIWDSTLAMSETARDFACTFAARRISDGGDFNKSPVSDVINGGWVVGCSDKGAYPTSCGATIPGIGPGLSWDPDVSCHQDMIKELSSTVQTSSAQSAAILQLYIDNEMFKNMTENGWASMGVWFAKLTSLNVTAQAAQDPGLTYRPGKVLASFDNCSTLAGLGSCDRSGVAYKTTMVMQEYDRWWQKAATEAGAAPGLAGAVAGSGNATQEIKQPWWQQLEAWGQAAWQALTGQGLYEMILTAVGASIDRNYFIYDIIDMNAKGPSEQVYPLSQLATVGESILSYGFLIVAAITAIQLVVSFLPIAGPGIAVNAIFEMISSIGFALATAGMLLTFYVPMIPFIRVAFAVLTWMASVFEAVVMIPIAALTYLTTEGEGYIPGGGKVVWLVWVQVLLRPIMTVIGFVAAMIIFNAFVILFHMSFTDSIVNVLESKNILIKWTGRVVYTIIYVGTMYSAANACFKLLEIIPAGLSKYMGAPQEQALGGDDSEKYMTSGSGAVMQTGRAASAAPGKYQSAMAEAKDFARRGGKELWSKKTGVDGESSKNAVSGLGPKKK